MHVTLVHVEVLPGHAAAFIEATRLNHQASIHEPGNLRFDVLQSADEPNRFLIYEAFAGAQHAAAHKNTAHYLRWRETVAPWMAAPRRGVAYRGLLPDTGAGS